MIQIPDSKHSKHRKINTFPLFIYLALHPISPCQGEGRGFESRLAHNKKRVHPIGWTFFFILSGTRFKLNQTKTSKEAEWRLKCRDSGSSKGFVECLLQRWGVAGEGLLSRPRMSPLRFCPRRAEVHRTSCTVSRLRNTLKISAFFFCSPQHKSHQ